jgi:tRNA threonylcarbamoyladenosine biosynthesis protein TsaE
MTDLVAATKSAEHTRELAGAVAGLLAPSDTILLAGDLGAGKTAFTQGLARALGIAEQVTSPTFTLMHNYTGGRLPLLHVDVYRVGRLQEVVDLGLPELLDDGAAAVIEWGDVAAPALPPDFLEVRIEFGVTDDERRFTFRPVGTRWAQRADALRRVLEGWPA